MRRQNCGRGIGIPLSDIQRLMRLYENMTIRERLEHREDIWTKINASEKKVICDDLFSLLFVHVLQRRIFVHLEFL